MPRGDKSKYTDKQERKADHIAEGYEKRGVSDKEAERRAWATVNKDDGGGKKEGGSGRGKHTAIRPPTKAARRAARLPHQGPRPTVRRPRRRPPQPANGMRNSTLSRTCLGRGSETSTANATQGFDLPEASGKRQASRDHRHSYPARARARPHRS